MNESSTKALRLDRAGLLVGTGLSRRQGMWKWVTYSLYAVLALITMRIIFRLVEFSGGVEPGENELPYKEGYVLGLDAVYFIFLVLASSAIASPRIEPSPWACPPLALRWTSRRESVRTEAWT